MTPTPSGNTTTTAPRLLVVEDERIVAMDLERKLQGMGYVVAALVASGEDAVMRAGELLPDLILMDISLEGKMDGVEAAGIIRNRHGIPIVYLTAYSNREIVARAKVTEPFGYILKPYVDRELQVVIEIALYRHRMEQQLLQQQHLLAATLKCIGDGVIATDAMGQVTFINPAAENLTGRGLTETLGLPIEQVFECVHESTRVPVDSPLLRAMAEKVGVPLANHTALIRKDKSEVSIDDAASPILDDAGRLLGGVLTFRDVTERRGTTKALAQLAAIVASSSEAIISAGPDGIIATWNAAAERLFGYTAAEVIGRHLRVLAPLDRVQEVMANIEKVKRGEPVLAHETVRKRADGQPIEVVLTISPLRAEEGEVEGMAAILRDVSELRRLEDRFRQAQKMESIGRLAGGLAHDFNNLLTVINGFTSLVLAGLHPHDPNREMLEHVEQAGERAAALTQQLLAYSRKQMLQPRVIDLAELIRGARKLLMPMLGASIEFRLIEGKDLPRIKADPAQLEQAVMNLAINARDAMEAGGTLTIETSSIYHSEASSGEQKELRPGPYVVLRVRDSGSGMDEHMLGQVFEPFFTTKEMGKGTGLGLAMVYGIVKQSGGHIEVESRAGQGSCFTIYLPAIEETPIRPSAAVSELPRGEETVLLVDDEVPVRLVAGEMLRRLGYKVFQASGGQEALELLSQEGKIDLLITDVTMPRMSGPQVAEAVRLIHPTVKVLYQSGHTDNALLRDGIQEARQNFLPKPFALAELARKVREVLDRG